MTVGDTARRNVTEIIVAGSVTNARSVGKMRRRKTMDKVNEIMGFVVGGMSIVLAVGLLVLLLWAIKEWWR